MAEIVQGNAFSLGRLWFPGQQPIVPFTGPDAAFARASAATWDDALWANILRRYGTGVLRRVVPINGLRAYGLEGGHTNYSVQSDMNTGWAGGGGSTFDDLSITGPDGLALSAGVVTMPASAAGRFTDALDAGLPKSVNIVTSFFGRRVGTPWSLDGPVGRFSDWDGNPFADNTESVIDDIAWQRMLGVAVDSGGGVTTPQQRIGNHSAEARDVGVYGAQVGVGAFAKSLVETSGGAATSESDDLECAVASGNPIQEEGFWFYLRPRFSSVEHGAEGMRQYLVSNSSQNALRFHVGNVLRIDGDGVAVSRGVAWARDAVLTIVIDWVNAEMRLDGFLSGNGTVDITAAGDWAGLTLFQIGATRTSLNDPYHGSMTELYPLASAPI